MSERPGRALPALSIVAALATIALTSTLLPDRVATHFGASGLPNGFMSRGTYLAFMAGIAIGIPTLLTSMIGAAIRRASGSINIPNRDYWLAAPRRAATIDYLVGHTAALATGVALFAVAMHFVLIHANGLTPPRLEFAYMVVPLAGAFAGILGWVVCLSRRFRLP